MVPGNCCLVPEGVYFVFPVLGFFFHGLYSEFFFSKYSLETKVLSVERFYLGLPFLIDSVHLFFHIGYLVVNLHELIVRVVVGARRRRL